MAPSHVVTERAGVRPIVHGRGAQEPPLIDASRPQTCEPEGT